MSSFVYWSLNKYYFIIKLILVTRKYSYNQLKYVISIYLLSNTIDVFIDVIQLCFFYFCYFMMH